MIKIRADVFETNSSSMHSIAIAKNITKYDVLDLEEPYFTRINYGNYILNNYDTSIYRNEFDILITLSEKVAYLLYYDYNINEINKILRKIIPNFESIKIKKSFHKNNEKELPDFSIANLLSNSKNVIIVDGDETYVCDNLFNVGLLKKELLNSRIFKQEFMEDEVENAELDD